MQNIAKDLRHAGRRLLRSPAFTLAAILTLALGIAANTSIFALVNRVILRPLPYPESDHLVFIDHAAPGIELPGTPGMSAGLYRYYHERAKTFSDLAMFRQDEWTLTGEGDPARMTGLVTTSEFGTALRVRPMRGRWYTEKEFRDGARVVVIAHSLWVNRFGSDPNMVGRSIRLDGIPREVIGVLPASVSYPNSRVQLYVPERLNEDRYRTVGGFNYKAIARLTGTSSVGDVKGEMDGLIAGLKAAFPGDPVAQQALDAAKLSGLPSALKDQIVGPVKSTLWILLGMVGLVLAIACANVANLFLVRSEARQREIAVRRALGAGRAGIIRYFLAESLVLSSIGATAGLAIAYAAVKLLVRFGPENLPRLAEVTIDARTIAWAALLAIASTILFAVIPLLRRADALSGSLREGGRSLTAGKSRFRARNALMAGQVALALILLIASGLMVKSFFKLRAVNPGFTSTNVFTFNVALNYTEYPNRTAALGFVEAVLTRLNALPGVERAAAINCLPLSGSCWGDPMQIRGKPPKPGELPPLVQLRRTVPGYLETMKIPVVQGRTHVAADNQQRSGAIVLSRRAADLYFAGQDPIGKQLGFMFNDPGEENWYTVVGVAGDTPVETLGEKPYGIVYLPAIDPVSETGADLNNVAFAIRTSVPPMTIARAVQAAAAEVNPNVALGQMRSMDMIVDDATARAAFTMMLLLIAGGIALLLGAVGIYGVISYVVGQRTSEIGVRMALGAAPGDVAGMVLRQSGMVVISGLVIGLFGALALTRLMTSLLFQVTPTDFMTYTLVMLFLLAVAGLASWIPARRAAGLEPLVALRKE